GTVAAGLVAVAGAVAAPRAHAPHAGLARRAAAIGRAGPAVLARRARAVAAGRARAAVVGAVQAILARAAGRVAAHGRAGAAIVRAARAGLARIARRVAAGPRRRAPDVGAGPHARGIQVAIDVVVDWPVVFIGAVVGAAAIVVFIAR